MEEGSRRGGGTGEGSMMNQSLVTSPISIEKILPIAILMSKTDLEIFKRILINKHP